MKFVKTLGLAVFALSFLALCKPKAAELAGDVYPISSASGDSYAIDTDASVINWLGKKVTGKHNGTLKVKSGSVSAKGDSITGGRIVIDMTSIHDVDMEGSPFQAKLDEHLKSPEFFDVGTHPEGFFEIASVTSTDKGLEARGNLTLKGVSKGIAFPVAVTFEGGKPKSAKGTALINRQQWGITYPGKPDDLIEDIIEIEFNLVVKN